MQYFSENRLTHFENQEPPTPQVEKTEKQRQEVRNKHASIETPDRFREVLQKVLESSFHLPASVTIGNAGEQPRGPQAFAGIWHNGNYVGTVISRTNTFDDPAHINNELREMFEQQNITLDYYPLTITPEAQKRMQQDQIRIVRGPGQHILMIGNERHSRIDYRTPLVNIQVIGQNLVIDSHTVGDNGDRMTFLPGNPEPVMSTLPPAPSRAQDAQKRKQEQSKNKIEESQEKKAAEEKMDKALNQMDREDNSISLNAIQTGRGLQTPQRGDVILQFPDGSRSLWKKITGRSGDISYQSQGAGRIAVEDDLQGILTHPQATNARYRIVP